MRLFFMMIVLMTMISSGCEEAIDCFTPPPEIRFKFFDTDHRNLIHDKIVDTASIRLSELDDKGDAIKNIDFSLGNDQITFYELGWKNGTTTYLFESNLIDVTFRVTANKFSTGKCGGQKIEDVQIEKVNYTKSENGFDYIFVIDR